MLLPHFRNPKPWVGATVTRPLSRQPCRAPSACQSFQNGCQSWNPPPARNPTWNPAWNPTWIPAWNPAWNPA